MPFNRNLGDVLPPEFILWIEQLFTNVQGVPGDPGPPGDPGDPGPPGDPGADGLSVLSGSGPPSGGTGVDGEFYIDISAWDVYGPKAAGVWPAGVSIIGPVGPTGPGSTVVAEGAAAAVSLTTTGVAVQVASLTMPTLVSGNVLEIEFTTSIVNSTANPRNYTPTLRMGGVTIITHGSTQAVPASATRVSHLRALMYVDGSPSQRTTSMYAQGGVLNGPIRADTTEPQSTPTIELWLATDLGGGTQEATQIMAVAKVT